MHLEIIPPEKIPHYYKVYDDSLSSKAVGEIKRYSNEWFFTPSAGSIFSAKELKEIAEEMQKLNQQDHKE